MGLSSLRFTNLCLSPVATIATLGEQVPLPYPVTNCYNYFSTSVIQTQLPLQFTVIMLLMLTILNRFNNSKYLFAPCYYFHPPILGWEFLPNISPPNPLPLSQPIGERLKNSQPMGARAPSVLRNPWPMRVWEFSICLKEKGA